MLYVLPVQALLRFPALVGFVPLVAGARRTSLYSPDSHSVAVEELMIGALEAAHH